MAFGYLQRMLLLIVCFAGFQRISVQNLILINEMVPEKFEHCMKMGHISANLYTLYIENRLDLLMTDEQKNKQITMLHQNNRY